MVRDFSLTAELLTWIKSTLKPAPSVVHHILTHYKWIWDLINNISYLRNSIMSYILTCKQKLLLLCSP